MFQKKSFQCLIFITARPPKKWLIGVKFDKEVEALDSASDLLFFATRWKN
jgi:hypothetical protein